MRWLRKNSTEQDIRYTGNHRFRVQNLGFRVWDLGFRDAVPHHRAERVGEVAFRVSVRGLGVR